MRNIIIITIAIVLPCSSFSQTEYKGSHLNINDLYSYALKFFCDSMCTVNDSLLYIDYDPLTTNNLTPINGNLALRVLVYDELYKLTTNKKSISLIKIFPIQHKQGSFCIIIASYKIFRKGKKLEYSLQSGMGAKVKYLYDCDAGGFVFSEIE